jgi:hypothetical protein
MPSFGHGSVTPPANGFPAGVLTDIVAAAGAFDRDPFDDDQVIGRIAGRERGLANLELLRAAVRAQSRQLPIAGEADC